MKTPVRIRVYVPSVEEVHVLVQRALRERVPIDRIATEAIFPDGKPRTWGEWSSAARDAWGGILAVYALEQVSDTASKLRVPSVAGGRPTPYAEVSVERAWKAVCESSSAPPGIRYTWPDISRRLGMSRRAAQHQLLGRLGFAFHGQGAARKMVSGPCLSCGKPFPVAEVLRSICESCVALDM